MMNSEEKGAAFDAMVADICQYGEAVFEGTNGRFVVVGWVDGHCDSIGGLSISATPEARGEMRQALAFASSFAREQVGEQG